MKIGRDFFERDAEYVAKTLLGNVLCRHLNGKVLRGKIVETEAYYGEDDPASWARFGKRKSNELMWHEPGRILIKNVHKHLMLNFVTGREGEPQAVLIRALEPLNFSGRCSGPGLLTEGLKLKKGFNGDSIDTIKEFWIETGEKDFEIEESFRIGVVKDINRKLRFYIKGNNYVSRNGKR